MSKEKEILVVISKTKAYIKEKGFMMSSDAIDTLNEKMYQLIEDAIERTKNNKRSTLRPHDF